MEDILGKLKNPFNLTRRKFITSILASSLSYFINPFNYAHSAEKFFSRLIKGEFRFFTPYQATIVDEVTSLIIPADEFPGAKETGVVFEIDQILSDSREMGDLYVTGLEWLDYIARKDYKKKSFLYLSHDQKINILKIADSWELPDMYDKSPIRRSRSEVIRIFFEVIKQQTFEAFYTSRSGWEIAGYKGPPQWSGNRNYDRCL